MDYRNLLFTYNDIRTRLTTEGDYRAAYTNMDFVAESIEKVVLALENGQMRLDDFDTYAQKLTASYENALDRQDDELISAAKSYFDGERDDPIAVYAAFLYDLNWFTQELFTLMDDTYLLAYVLKYPDSMVIGSHIVPVLPESVVSFEVPDQIEEESVSRTYTDEVQWTQKRAAGLLIDQIDDIYAEYPNPDELLKQGNGDWGIVEETYEPGGIKILIGRDGLTFHHSVERVEVNPNRFESSVDGPRIIEKDIEWLNPVERHEIPERPLSRRWVY